MGVIKRGILGGFRGKVANIVGTSWKGRAVIKSLPLSVANPKTAGQVKQRNKFSITSKLASAILAFWVKPLWDRFAGDISGYNAYVSNNINYVSDSGIIDFNSIEQSKGSLFPSVIDQVSGNSPGSTSLNVQGDTDTGVNGLTSDIRFILVLDGTTGDPLGSVNDQTRASSSSSVQLNRPLVSGELLYVYQSMLREDGTLVSNSEAKSVTVSQ